MRVSSCFDLVHHKEEYSNKQRHGKNTAHSNNGNSSWFCKAILVSMVPGSHGNTGKMRIAAQMVVIMIGMTMA